MNLIVDFPVSRNNSDIPDIGYEIDENRVRFSSHEQIWSVPSLLRSEFKDDLWFSRHQLDLFKQESINVLNKIKSEGQGNMIQYIMDNIEDSGYYMGLEPFLDVSMTRKVVLCRRKHTRAVLDEQKRQIDAGIYDVFEMERVSEAHSRSSRKRAMIIAKLHAME